MKVIVTSHFRNAAANIKTYFKQMHEFQEILHQAGIGLFLLLGYGDSDDQTTELLHSGCVMRFDSRLVNVSHGGPEYGPVIDKQRFKQLALVTNTLWRNLPLGTGGDVVVYVESDLRWRGETLASLVEGLGVLRSVSSATSAPTLLAPMVYDAKGLFYDTWAFRAEGLHFNKKPPYHPRLAVADDYLEMDSVGSCFALNYSLAKQLRWPEEDVVVGLCRQAKALGARIFLDKKARVHHP